MPSFTEGCVRCGGHAGCGTDRWPRVAQTAVAVSLGLRTYVSIEPASTPGFHLQLPDVDVDEVFSVETVRSLRPTASVDVFATPPAIEPELRDQLSAAVAATPHAPSAQARTVFVYLAAHLLPDDPCALAHVAGAAADCSTHQPAQIRMGTRDPRQVDVADRRWARLVGVLQHGARWRHPRTARHRG